jgi:hypothetical protein
VLESLPAEELPDLAIAALLASTDTTSLRLLAGLSTWQARDDPKSAWDLFRTAVNELGLALPNLCDALHAEIREWAYKLSTGECTLREAADGIASLGFTHLAHHRCPELPVLTLVVDADTFGYLEDTGQQEAAELGRKLLQPAILALLDPSTD